METAYSGMEPLELRKLRRLEKENQKLKRLVAYLSWDKAILHEVLAKKYSAWPSAGDCPLGSAPVPVQRAPQLCGPQI